MVQAATRPSESVVAAERAFAAEAAARGTSAAFVAAFAPDGLVFTPEPTNARARHAARPDDGSRLAWEPAFVEVAASGDFALSTGPWSWQAKGAPAPSAFGHFLTLWVRRAGRWEVKLDVGVSHPAPPAEGLRQVDHLRLGGPITSPEAAWAAFDQAAGTDLAGAFQTAGAADLRLYRAGRAVHPGNLTALIGGEAGPVRWEALGREEATSGDLAVRWGHRLRGSLRTTALQVWRRGPEGWRLAMDVNLSPQR
ncbi:MAG TPA: nuclear transport factor 2 family protein [Holophagaceae bacterium]